MLYPATGSSSETGGFQLNWIPTGTALPCNGIERLLLPMELLATTNTPFVVPSDVGLNIRFRVAECPGGNVAGKLSPVVVNPAPEVVAEVIVTGAVPVEVRVSDWVDTEFNAACPKETELAFALRTDADGPEGVPICKLKDAEDPSPVAVNVVSCPEATAEIVALKFALEVCSGTVISPGTATAALELERVTFSPPLGAFRLSFTAHASVPG
jgi:hypothetical protein